MPADHTYKHNTTLPAAVEDKFRDWVDAQKKIIGRDMMKDLSDYDLRGYFVKYGGADLESGRHLTDEFKKPNHPTFSEESKYHGVDGAEGGKWTRDGKRDVFEPGKTNLEQWDKKDLEKYFSKHEPDVVLRLPGKVQPLPEPDPEALPQTAGAPVPMTTPGPEAQ